MFQFQEKQLKKEVSSWKNKIAITGQHKIVGKGCPEDNFKNSILDKQNIE